MTTRVHLFRQILEMSWMTLPLSSSIHYLLKTFSINPFQGQYPNMAVRITTSPIGPRIHRETPEVKKAMIISTTPMIKRKIPSPFPIFFVFIAAFSSINPSAIHRFGGSVPWFGARQR